MTAAGVSAARLELELQSCLGTRSMRGATAQGIAFWLCCAYVLSQIYLVPVWLVGPSWSVWPSLTDLLFPVMLVLLPFLRRAAGRLSSDTVVLQRFFWALAIGSALSYVVLTLDPFHLNPGAAFNDKGQGVGLYQLYRVTQSLIVFWLVMRTPLTVSRRRLLCRVVGITFWVSAALLLADYFHLLATPTLAPQIPKDLNVAGPWAFYSRGIVGQAVGAIGFHHVYPCIQLLALAALYLHLLYSKNVWLQSLVLGCLWTCGFVSGSRGGFVAICVFVAAVVIANPRRFLAMVVVVATLVVGCFHFSESFSQAFSAAVDRQGTISTSYEDDGFAGRVEIWNERVALLNENAVSWLVGTGFGSAVQSGSNGHMLFLHVTLECGLIGLAAFFIVTWKILAFVWRRPAARIVYFGTIALLISALTQETFYPVPSLSQFGGLYLFCVGIALHETAKRQGGVVA
ncbi:MAG TPA: O-antigen ligase family protein [Nitrospira sp.]|nr:O-antigen ligase family protein [Nitrospira sp.]